MGQHHPACGRFVLDRFLGNYEAKLNNSKLFQSPTQQKHQTKHQIKQKRHRKKLSLVLALTFIWVYFAPSTWSFHLVSPRLTRRRALIATWMESKATHGSHCSTFRHKKVCWSMMNSKLNLDLLKTPGKKWQISPKWLFIYWEGNKNHLKQNVYQDKLFKLTKMKVDLITSFRQVTLQCGYPRQRQRLLHLQWEGCQVGKPAAGSSNNPGIRTKTKQLPVCTSSHC